MFLEEKLKKHDAARKKMAIMPVDLDQKAHCIHSCVWVQGTKRRILPDQLALEHSVLAWLAARKI